MSNQGNCLIIPDYLRHMKRHRENEDGEYPALRGTGRTTTSKGQ